MDGKISSQLFSDTFLSLLKVISFCTAFDLKSCAALEREKEYLQAVLLSPCRKERV